MGESSSALTISAKVFAAYLPPGSHGESFWLTATVCTCQLQAQSRWQAYVYVDISLKFTSTLMLSLSAFTALNPEPKRYILR